MNKFSARNRCNECLTNKTYIKLNLMQEREREREREREATDIKALRALTSKSGQHEKARKRGGNNKYSRQNVE